MKHAYDVADQMLDSGLNADVSATNPLSGGNTAK